MPGKKKKSNNKKKQQESDDIHLSKALAYLLRHGAADEGVPMSEDGYIDVKDVLAWKRKYTEADVRRVVANNDKKRFALKEDCGSLLICANQGHSLRDVKPDTMKEVTDPADFPTVIHGTYYKAWESIRRTGLNRMQRNHVHFATGRFGEVISGMRASAQIYVYVDLPKCMEDGIKFQVSANGVLLSEGVDGVIPPCYFVRAVDAATSEELEYDRGVTADDIDCAIPPAGAAEEGKRTLDTWILSIEGNPFKTRKQMKKAFKEGAVMTGINDEPLERNHPLGDDPITLLVKAQKREFTITYPDTTEWPAADALAKKGKMRTCKDVISRIKFDSSLHGHTWLVAYEDRFDGIQEVTLDEWDDGIDEALGCIPEHRIQYFRKDGEIVWDRKKKIDLVFGE